MTGMTMRGLGAMALAVALTCLVSSVQAQEDAVGVAPREARVLTAGEAMAAMRDGTLTSAMLVGKYLRRIDKLDRQGPTLRAIIAVNPSAMEEARARDAERRAGRLRGPLHGLPIVIKDNIEMAGPLPTTAGSLALAANVTGRDAPLVARLKAAGAIVIAKANLSEWANIRSTASTSGWSAVGGLVRNPHAHDRTACGSSSGTGAAIAADFAAVGVGTETDGSVVCPAAMNGIVGLKPTMGLVSRTHIVPISHSQDIAGPMGRSVADVALLLGAMVGSDPADPATKDADRHARDHVAALADASLAGRRLAVLRPATMHPALAQAFDAALGRLRAAGAVLVEVKEPATEGLDAAEFEVLKYELKADLNAYLATTPATVRTRTLAQVMAFNRAEAAREMPLFGQEIFEAADALGSLDTPAYRQARATSFRLARDAIETMLSGAKADAYVTPTYGLPWKSDTVNGDQFQPPSASTLPAVSGYPHLTVPMGLARGLPVGLSFVGRPHADGALLALGHAFERTGPGSPQPAWRLTVDAGPAIDGGQ